MDHDRRWRVAERYHVLFLRRRFLDLVLVCGGRLSADFESHFSQNIFVAYSRNPVNRIPAMVSNPETTFLQASLKASKPTFFSGDFGK